MSYNLTLNNTYAYEIAALTAAIKPLINAWQAAISDEEQANIEAELVRDLDTYLNFKPKDFVPHAGQIVTQEDFNHFWKVYEKHLILILAKLDVLAQKYINYTNAETVALASLKASVLKLNQKTAALRLWNNEEVKYALSEYFTNADKINPGSTLELHEISGMATLPVLKRTSLQPHEVLITRNSLGRAGNSNLSINRNGSLTSLFGNNPQIFYFENLNGNEVKISLRLVFNKPEVINCLSLRIQPISYGSQPYVNNIVFETASGKRSIEEMSTLFHQHKSFVNNQFEFLFMPVLADSIEFQIVQSGYDFIRIQNQNRVLSTKQSLIGLEHIGVWQYTYGNAGELISLPQPISEGLFLSEADLKSDLVSELQQFRYLIDVGNGFIESEDGATHLLDGRKTDLRFKLGIQKNSNSDLYQKFNYQEVVLQEVNTQTKLVGNSSPVFMTLKECNTTPFVYTPYQMRRGPIRRKLLLSRAFNTAQRHRIPFDLKSTGLQPQRLRVFVNGVPLTYVYAEPSNNQFSVNEDLDSIILTEDYESGSEIEIVIDEEELVFEQRPDGFYCKLDTLFDPDKETIEIKYLPATLSSRDVFLPRDQRVIYLQDKFIDESTLVVKDQDGNILAPQGTLGDVNSVGDFYVDTKNGVIYLDTATGDGTWSVTYKHRTPKLLDSNDYTIVFDGDEPWGLRIKNDKLICFSNTETFDSTLASDINPLTGLSETRTNHFSLSENKKLLSYKNILKGSVVISDNAFGLNGVPEEIPFQDGVTEFLGLISVEETTVAIEESAGLVSFTLAAGGYWYKEFGLLEADSDWFSNAVANLGSISSVGDYFISDAGVVTLKTGTGTDLPANLVIRYYYKDPQFKPSNKYSVDYKNGTVYSYSSFASATSFTYKVANYTASYDLINQIKNFDWNTETKYLSVNLDLGMKTKFIKAAWQRRSAFNHNLNLKDYYSPIIDQFGIRFY